MPGHGSRAWYAPGTTSVRSATASASFGAKAPHQLISNGTSSFGAPPLTNSYGNLRHHLEPLPRAPLPTGSEALYLALPAARNRGGKHDSRPGEPRPVP